MRKRVKGLGMDPEVLFLTCFLCNVCETSNGDEAWAPGRGLARAVSGGGSHINLVMSFGGLAQVSQAMDRRREAGRELSD